MRQFQGSEDGPLAQACVPKTSALQVLGDWDRLPGQPASIRTWLLPVSHVVVL